MVREEGASWWMSSAIGLTRNKKEWLLVLEMEYRAKALDPQLVRDSIGMGG